MPHLRSEMSYFAAEIIANVGETVRLVVLAVGQGHSQLFVRFDMTACGLPVKRTSAGYAPKAQLFGAVEAPPGVHAVGAEALRVDAAERPAARVLDVPPLAGGSAGDDIVAPQHVKLVERLVDGVDADVVGRVELGDLEVLGLCHQRSSQS